MPKRQKDNLLNNVTHTRKASLTKADATNPNTLSFTMVSDTNSGTRYNWGSGKFYEEFLDVTGADVSRLNTFFKDHNNTVDSAIGRVENVRVEDGQLVGDVVFGTDEDSQRVYNKYRDGILTDVSIGYSIKEYTVEEREGANDEVTITSYEVFELSAVGIGFDGNAKKREDDFMTPEEIKARLAEIESMSKRTAEEKAELADLQDKVRKLTTNNDSTTESNKRIADLEAANAEHERKFALSEIAKQRNVSDELLATFLSDEKRTVDEFNVAILDEIEKQTATNTISMREMGADASKDIEDALVIRAGGTVEDASAFASKLSRAAITDMMNILHSTKDFDKIAIAERSMLSGEFPLLLANAGNRTLEQEYESQSLNFKQWVKEVDLIDFRTNQDITRGTGGRLDRVGENGDLKERKIVENGESWKLATYGNKFALTREMIVNDDLGAFNTLVSDLVESSALTVNGLAYDMLRQKGQFSNYKMADGSGLYVAARNNKMNVPFSKGALKQAIELMSKHKGIGGKTKLSIKPTYLHIGSMSDYFMALEILNSTANMDDNKNSGNVNVMRNIVTPIIDSELGDGEWFLTANRRTIKVGYLAGTNRRPIIKMNSTSIMRTEFEGVFDIGVMAEDYRGLFAGKMA